MPTIHPTAQISPEVELAGEVEVGPFAVIEGPVRLEAGVKIAGHAWISGRTRIGGGTRIGWGAVVGAEPQDFSFDPSTDSGVEIGRNNTLREYVTVHRSSKPGGNTVVGDGNLLMTGVHLGHDSRIGNGNVLANNVLLGGHVLIGDNAFLGGGAACHQFVHVGDLSMVQGLTAVSQDVPPYCVAHGINRLSGLNTVGLRRAGIDADQRTWIKRAYKLIYLSGLTREGALAEAAATEWPGSARRFLDAVARPSKKGVMSP